MSRRVRLVLAAAGVGLFLALLRGAGTSLWIDARRTGWMIVPIVALYALAHLLDAGAWATILRDEPTRPSFSRTLLTLVSGSAINSLTPLVNAGGEPYRIAALAPWTGLARATASVVLHAMVRTLGLLLFYVLALLLGFGLLPRTAPWRWGLTAGLLGVGGLVALLLAGHRRGVLARLLDGAARLPGMGRLARRLEPHRTTIAAMDRRIAAFYHERPARFRVAVGLTLLSRLLIAVEFCLIGASIGRAVGWLDAVVVAGLEGLLANLLFVVPFELGAREGATLLLFTQLGYPASLGLYAALVSRARDLAWIGIGLALVGFGGRVSGPAAITPEGSPP